jgi:hypothetical protein
MGAPMTKEATRRAAVAVKLLDECIFNDGQETA